MRNSGFHSIGGLGKSSLDVKQTIELEKQILDALGEESILVRDLVWILLQSRHPIKPEWVKQAYQNGWYPIREDALLFDEICAIEEKIKHLEGIKVLEINHGYVKALVK